LAGTGAEIRQDVVWEADSEQGCPHAASASRDIAISFLRLANLNNEIVDQLSRLRRQSTSKTPDSLPDRVQVCR